MCWRCMNARPWPAVPKTVELKWDIRPLLERTTAEELKSRYGAPTYASWRSYGIPDLVADQLAVGVLKMHPAQVWRGWAEASRDYYGELEPTCE